jgi:hypothetical protein
MQQMGIPFDISARKHQGNENSQEANLRAIPMKGRNRERIRKLVAYRKDRGATLKELSVLLGKFPHQVSGRITELKKLGEIFDSNREPRDGCSVLVARKEWCRGCASENHLDSPDWERFWKCDRKVRYGHRDTADRASDHMTRKYREAFESYECQHCGKWHIGHAR